MKTSRLYILAAAFITPLFIASCESKMEPTLTEVHPVLAPAVYGAFEQPSTRVVPYPIDIQNAEHNGFTSVPNAVPLPIGSTVWLMYRRANDGITNPDPNNSAHWGPSDLKAYVVKADEEMGFNALYPVPYSENTSEGTLVISDNLESYATPLYLNDGYYQFRAVSPAYPIRKTDYKMKVDNGMWLYANDERYNQTKSAVIYVGGTNVQNVQLQPMISQVARIDIRLSPKSNNISKMEIMDQGIEISGLQNPETTDGSNLMFQWSSMSIADTLKMKRGEKGRTLVIHDFTTEESGAIVGTAAILPTDAMSTMVVVLINMAVNGIPTQYILTLSQMKFFHGHSYLLDLELDLNGNVYVMNWANQSWSGEAHLN